jgi:hypothetical protein
MRGSFMLLAVTFCLPVFAAAQTNETIVPAGTLLQCTLDEPRFSSATAQVGDPILCHVNSLGMFGRPVFPRGAYLSGRLQEFRDPGHFFGKGWLKLEFETLTLPGGTFPIAAKIVSVPQYRVDAEGRVRGRGHPRRDAIEWSFPVLWPEKLITLPARGPRPVLKGETRILLRVLEEIAIPNNATSPSSASAATAALSMPAGSRTHASVNPGADSKAASSWDSGFSPNLNVSSSRAAGVLPRLRYGGVSMPAADLELPSIQLSAQSPSTILDEAMRAIDRPWRAPTSTFLVCKDGRAYVASNYWFEAGQLVYFAADGMRQAFPIRELDLETTTDVNRERGVPFVIRSNPAEPSVP